MAHIQQQIRENSMELQDYLKELKDWEAKAKAKDQMLRGGTDAAPPQDAPPVRGLKKKEPVSGGQKALGGTDPQSNGEGKQGKHKNAAGHTYDYFRDKWDKFDVEKALAEADAESPGPTKSSETLPLKPTQKAPPITSPAAIPVPPKEKRPSSKFSFSNGNATESSSEKGPDAASEKEEGNRLFKAGRFQEALDCYTRSILLNPTSVSYANRAMAALKLELFLEAEEDCTETIKLDAQYVKAYSRRGRARSHLGKWLEATQDFEFALRLEPQNKELLQEYSAAREACLQEANLSPSTAVINLPVYSTQTSQKPAPPKPSPASNPLGPSSRDRQGSGSEGDSVNSGVLKQERVESTAGKESPAVTIGSSKTEADSGMSSLRKPRGKSEAPEDSRSIERKGAQVNVHRAENGQLGTEVGAVSPSESKKNIQSDSPTTKLEGNSALRATRTGTKLEISESAPPNHETSSPNRIDTKASPRGHVSADGSSAAASAAAERLQRALAENVSAPKTAYEFEAQWKGFKDDGAAKAKLLKTLAPSHLAPFFKESLQAPLLCEMLRVVAGWLLPGDAAFAADLLEGLTGVPRFAMTVMFISAKEKQSLRDLWDVKAKDSSIPAPIQARLASCRTKYRS